MHKSSMACTLIFIIHNADMTHLHTHIHTHTPHTHSACKHVRLHGEQREEACCDAYVRLFSKKLIF